VTPTNSITPSSQWTTLSGQFNVSGYTTLSMATMFDYTNYSQHTVNFQGYHTHITGTRPYVSIYLLTASGTSMGIAIENDCYSVKRNTGITSVDTTSANTYFLLTDTGSGCEALQQFVGSIVVPNVQNVSSTYTSMIHGYMHYTWPNTGNSQTLAASKLTSSNQIGGLQFQFMTTNYATTTYFATIKYNIQSF
jgi:hypothetical protein